MPTATWHSRQKVLGGMIQVVISEGRDEEVAVVIVWLQTQVDVLVVACFLGCLDKVLR